MKKLLVLSLKRGAKQKTVIKSGGKRRKKERRKVDGGNIKPIEKSD